MISTVYPVHKIVPISYKLNERIMAHMSQTEGLFGWSWTWSFVYSQSPGEGQPNAEGDLYWLVSMERKKCWCMSSKALGSGWLCPLPSCHLIILNPEFLCYKVNIPWLDGSTLSRWWLPNQPGFQSDNNRADPQPPRDEYVVWVRNKFIVLRLRFLKLLPQHDWGYHDESNCLPVSFPSSDFELCGGRILFPSFQFRM